MRKLLEKVSKSYQLEPRPNRDVENSFRAYETSFETEHLESERNRKIYCELIDFGRRKNLAKHSDIKTTKNDTDKLTVEVGESDEYVAVETADVDKKQWWTDFYVDKTNCMKTFVEIAVMAIAAEFKGGAVDAKVQCQDAVDFGLYADINLPIQDLLQLDVS